MTPSSPSPALVAENGTITAWHSQLLAELPVACVIVHESLYITREKSSSLFPKALVLLIHRAYCVR